MRTIRMTWLEKEGDGEMVLKVTGVGHDDHYMVMVSVTTFLRHAGLSLDVHAQQPGPSMRPRQ